MKLSRGIALSVVLSASFATAVLAQEAPPKEPFKAVHLIALKSPAEVTELQAALADMNAAVAKVGYADVRYRLFKVVGKQTGKYNYMWESAWPGGEVYDKVHNSPDWNAAVKRHPKVEEMMKENDVYNRYVEVSKP